MPTHEEPRATVLKRQHELLDESRPKAVDYQHSRGKLTA